MKANELRIGNIVSHEDYSGEPFEVVSIEKYKDEYVINTKGGKNGTWINPISLVTKVPITKDWLIKFGFWYNEDKTTYYWGSYLQLGFNLDVLDFIYYNLDYSLKLFTRKIKYVHELQNLCFELEKEQELKLNKFRTEEEALDLPY